MGAVVYVIAVVLHSTTTAGVVAGAVTAFIAALWFVLPLTYPREEDVEGTSPAAEGAGAGTPVP
jgi:hypothetical protein